MNVFSEDIKFENRSKYGDDRQLVFKLDLYLPESSILSVVELLINSGAEVNLIREGLVPENLLSHAQ